MLSEIMFVKPRWQYDSYTDFWKLIELSEYEWIYVDEMDLMRNVIYITAPYNGEWEPFVTNNPARRCALYLWNLERPAGSGGLQQYKDSNWKLIDTGLLDGVIVSDRALASHTGFTYCPIGSHRSLGTPGTEKRYDIIHLSCYSYRRGFLFSSPGISRTTLINGLTVAPNSWDAERHRYLQGSRVMLNIHQDSNQYMEPLRFALAAAYGLPIATDKLLDGYPYEENVDYWTIEIDDKTAFHKQLDEVVTNSATTTISNKLTEGLTFRKGIEEYL